MSALLGRIPESFIRLHSPFPQPALPRPPKFAAASLTADVVRGQLPLAVNRRLEAKACLSTNGSVPMMGPQDLWVALSLGVFLFGAKKLPELSRSLGQALAQFRKGLADGQDEARSSDAVALAPKAAVSHDSESQRPDS